MGARYRKHRCISRFKLLFSIVLSFGMGMILMYWLVDWGTHGYACDTVGNTNVCSKEY